MDIDTKMPSRVSQLLNDTQQLVKLKLLIVGVGGIGCELLKVLCKMPISQIHIIDMDTIQISNLNRQFLFKTQHKGQSKALVAKQTIKKINPLLNIEAHHKNIRQLPISFFKSFSYLIMALDNIQTRNYVNKIGVRLNIPTIDAGTLGYKGNVHIIIPHKTRCYSCQPKVSSQKSFPVCTIRMRPQKPIHCIVWAKMLFQVLFSGQQVNNDMKDLDKLAENGDQNNLLKQLLHTQILNIKEAKTDSDSLLAQDYILKIKPVPLDFLSESKANLDDYDMFDSNKIDMKILVGLAKSSFIKLLQQKKNQGSVIFQKDDDTIIHFISSLANLRMSCFSIQQQSFNEVKNMAGNIVPAIASTNSIVSGLQVTQMIKLLNQEQGDQRLRSYYIQNQSYKIRALKVQRPIAGCLVCSSSATPVIMETNMKTTTFKQVIQKLKQIFQRIDLNCQYSINQGEKQLYNSEQPNQKIQSRKLIQISNGSYEMDLKISDEDNSETICTFWIYHNEEISGSYIKNESNIEKNVQHNRKLRKEKENHNEDATNQNGENKQTMVEKQEYSDIIMEVNNHNNKQQSSDQLQIIEVHKKGQNEGKNDKNQVQIQDKVQKKIKD